MVCSDTVKMKVLRGRVCSRAGLEGGGGLKHCKNAYGKGVRTDSPCCPGPEFTLKMNVLRVWFAHTL